MFFQLTWYCLWGDIGVNACKIKAEKKIPPCGRDSAVGFGKQLLSDKYLRQESFFNKKSIVLRSIGNLLAV